jgi:hypothetical protein
MCPTCSALWRIAADPPTILQMDPKSKVPIITRMAGAPGFIHWFDPKSSHVIGELEIAAYNDTMLSENTGVGNFCKVKSFASDGDDLSDVFCNKY